MLFYLPEEPPYSLSFDQCGYGSTLLITNISIIIWIYAFHAALLVITLPIWLTSRLENFKAKFSSYFFWNGLIRLFMETFFELVLTAVLNMRMVDWLTPYPAVNLSTALAMISLILVSVLSPFLVFLYWRNFSILAEDRFKSKYGAGLVGTNLVKKVQPRSILAFPMIFFGRRVLFAVSAVLLKDCLWAQLAIQIMVSVFMIIYLMWYKPLESPFALRIEVMNECTVIVQTYGLFCFTDFVPAPETRIEIAYVYMGVCLANILVHLTLLLLATGHKLKLMCKKKFRCCRKTSN